MIDKNRNISTLAPTKGIIKKISGPLIVAEGLEGVKMNEVVRVGGLRLVGEVVELHGKNVFIQVYEETAGLKPGEEVVATGAPLSVQLGPGLIGTIFDGIQRPLETIREKTGDFISRGVEIYGLDTEKKWKFEPVVKEGDTVRPGTIIGKVQETTVVEHRVMVPSGVEGKIEKISNGEFTVLDEVAVVQDKGGRRHSITMSQKWPVRIKRLYEKKFPPNEPLISGQRVIDTFFPIAKGGVACIPGPFGSGKCVSGDTPVLLSTGKILPISEIYEKFKLKGKKIKGIDEDYTILDSPLYVYSLWNGKIDKFKVQAVYRGKSKSLIKITTRSGREFKVTPIHKLTRFKDLKEQQVEAGKLKENDYLIMPRLIKSRVKKEVELPWQKIFENFRVTEPKVLNEFHKALDILKRELGNLKKVAEVLNLNYSSLINYWIGRNLPPLKILLKTCKLARVNVSSIKYIKGERKSYSTIIPKKLDEKTALFLGLIAGDGQWKNRSIRFYNNNPEIQHLFAKLVKDIFALEVKKYSMKTVEVLSFESPVVVELLNYIGFPEYKKSKNITLPKGLLLESCEIRAKFLSGYFISDGYFNKKKGEIEIATSSKKMFRDLGYLLAFIGIGASFKRRQSSGSTSWRIFIRGKEEIKKFLNLGYVDVQKFRNIQEYIKNANKTFNSWDIIPLSKKFIEGIYNKNIKNGEAAQSVSNTEALAEGVYNELGRPYKKLKDAGVEIFNYTVGENMGRGIFQKFADFTKNPELIKFAHNHLSSVFIDRIDRIEIIENSDSVYDIEVEKAHNFIGGITPSFFSNTVVQQQLAKWTDADIVVYIGCGERGNEMTDVLQEFPLLEDPNTGEPLIKRTVLIANTSNMPVAAREASIYTGTTIAEYYRDMGYKVALMADSTSRWAEALREMSGRLEEMPGEEGYPAYLASRIAEFYERAGRCLCLGGEREGSLSIIGAVSPPGGDMSDPVVKNTLRVVKVFWGLDDDLAAQRHFPAIHWLRSYSLYIDNLADYFTEKVGKDFVSLRDTAISILQEEESLEEIVRLVGEESLSDKDRQILDTAKMLREDFLQQHAFDPEETYTPIAQQYRMIKAIISFHNTAIAAIEEGKKFEDIVGLKVKEKIAKMKYISPKNLDEFDRIYKDIEEQIKGL